MFKSTRVIVLGLLFSMAHVSFGQVEKVQAGLFYYFSRYIDWPAAKSSGDFVIAVVGKDAIVPHLEAMAKTKRVGSRRIVIKQVSTVAQGGDSHIMYISKNQLGQFSKALGISASKNILLVTNEPGYGQKGAGINLIVHQGKPAYQLNDRAVASCGLKTSARLATLGNAIR